jgi:thioredoxin-related protein
MKSKNKSQKFDVIEDILKMYVLVLYHMKTIQFTKAKSESKQKYYKDQREKIMTTSTPNIIIYYTDN